MALGAFHFRASDNQGKFLFFSWDAKAVKFWTAVRKMTSTSPSTQITATG
jgi:hypothetical protein